MSKINSSIWTSDLGLISYSEAFELQQKLRLLRIQKKIPNLFLFVSHPPVFTLGKRPCEEDFLSPKDKVLEAGIEIQQSNRGGKITYHGPGQIVGYFIFDLRFFKLSIPTFVEKIEEILIQTLEEVGLKAHRDPEYPGVWLENKKIAALGLHFDRGVSMHGFALNVNPDLKYYQHIIPCGIQGREVTSLKNQNIFVEETEMKKRLLEKMEKIFGGKLETLRPVEIYSEVSKLCDF